MKTAPHHISGKRTTKTIDKVSGKPSCNNRECRRVFKLGDQVVSVAKHHPRTKKWLENELYCNNTCADIQENDNAFNAE